MIYSIIDSKRKIIFLLWVLLCIGFLATSIVSYVVSGMQSAMPSSSVNCR